MSKRHRNHISSLKKAWHLPFLRPALFSILALICLQQCKTDDGVPAILVFTKAEGYVHESTQAAEEALRSRCRDNNIKIVVTDDGEKFTEDNLRKYAAIIFLNTAGDVLNAQQEKALEKYMHAGGGFLGIHTAIDTEHNWDWYGKLIGARFKSQTETLEIPLIADDQKHPASEFIDGTHIRKDEWFALKEISPEIQILLSIGENSFKNGPGGNFNPVSWYHEFEGGRVFVTTMGHTSESYTEEFFLKHLMGGLKYVIGENKLRNKNDLFSVADSTATSSPTGYVKTNVACDLYEPMAMDIFPDGKIIFIERQGAVKLFDPVTGSVKVTNNLEVFTGGEEGLLGIALDPGWNDNHWIYLYYTPKNDSRGIRLSRFAFVNNTLQTASEKVLLTVPTLKGTDNYHAAGSIEFDDKGFLYLSTGDNSSPRANEYAVIDERRGREAFDAQKSSSNSMDLRGKILRIKPLHDGSYLCPKGNLYVNQDVILSPESEQNRDDPNYSSKLEGRFNSDVLEGRSAGSIFNSLDSSVGRPEIFVMGVRNPFRISFDDRRQTLYWGDVGPDAGISDSLHGPEGYDEINAAQTAGFYGWPYVIGPNLPYRDFDHKTNSPGAYFDPNRPVNNSPNNTGTRNLPPARSPLIWYSFRSSKEFPAVANGTRCIMAGPTYYCDQYPESSRFPRRYDKKLLIYEWMRNWIMAVTIDSAGNYIKMEPFAENLRLNRPVDMLIARDGSLWLLEYGIEWYSKNKEACLSRINFVAGSSDMLAGSVSSAEPPVQWDFFNRNRSFYEAGEMIPYKLKFADQESEHLVSFEMGIHYNETTQSAYQFSREYHGPTKSQNKFWEGQILIDKSDCRSCHALDRNINGPAYLEIASRYHHNSAADTFLIRKIISGGNGNWGTRSMIPHPNLNRKDAGKIVNWILSLNDQSTEKISREGRYRFNVPDSSKNKEGLFVFHASINGSFDEKIVFRPNLLQIEKADSFSKSVKAYKRIVDGKPAVLSELKNKDFFVLKGIDLHGIKTLDFELEISKAKNQTGGGMIELHLDRIDGPVIGSIDIPTLNDVPVGEMHRISMAVNSTTWPRDNLFHNLIFAVKGQNKGNKPVAGLDWIKFKFK